MEYQVLRRIISGKGQMMSNAVRLKGFNIVPLNNKALKLFSDGVVDIAQYPFNL